MTKLIITFHNYAITPINIYRYQYKLLWPTYVLDNGHEAYYCKKVNPCLIAPQRTLASSFSRFLDHTQRRATVGRTPLDQWWVRRRDLYLTTHNTHKSQTSMPPTGFEPAIPASERPQTQALERAATGISYQVCTIMKEITPIPCNSFEGQHFSFFFAYAYLHPLFQNSGFNISVFIPAIITICLFPKTLIVIVRLF